jgi:hypothetical protein
MNGPDVLCRSLAKKTSFKTEREFRKSFYKPLYKVKIKGVG